MTLGLKRKQVKRAVSTFPLLLNYSIEEILQPKVQWLMTLGLSKDDFGQAVSIFHQLLGIGYSIVATVAVVAGHPGGLLRLLRAAPPRAARHLGHLQPLRGPRHRGLYNRCATSINIWVNYNDLTATSLEIIVSKGNHPKMALIQVSEIL